MDHGRHAVCLCIVFFYCLYKSVYDTVLLVEHLASCVRCHNGAVCR